MAVVKRLNVLFLGGVFFFGSLKISWSFQFNLQQIESWEQARDQNETDFSSGQVAVFQKNGKKLRILLSNHNASRMNPIIDGSFQNGVPTSVLIEGIPSNINANTAVGVPGEIGHALSVARSKGITRISGWEPPVPNGPSDESGQNPNEIKFLRETGFRDVDIQSYFRDRQSRPIEPLENSPNAKTENKIAASLDKYRNKSLLENIQKELSVSNDVFVVAGNGHYASIFKSLTEQLGPPVYESPSSTPEITSFRQRPLSEQETSTLENCLVGRNSNTRFTNTENQMPNIGQHGN